ncbi:hypothetical protein XANCAGTX0491_009927 [Xanthoria calcicola]
MSDAKAPSPISWAPSQWWEGDDGQWSTFDLRVGSPEQNVRVLPSTAGSATWVVTPDGCDPPSSTCTDARGGIFNQNQSSTWKDLGLFTLNLEQNLNHNESGAFGLDTISLGLSNATGGPTLDSQIIAGIETPHWYTAVFGLQQRPMILDEFSQPQQSFLSALRARNLIPSLSWAYTAGARYRSKGSFGSLTLGGSDISKYVPTNISFSLASDVARDLVVGIKSITSTYNNGSVSSLLPSPTLAFIDSTVPYLYLPEDACKAFESELGLVYNKKNNLYFVDDPLHQTLTNINPKFTFRLANDKSSDPSVDIILPYASFDLVLKPPLRSNATSYFPLRRGNDSQITLGRAFLQEAYIITDYDHQNFTVAQTRFGDTARPNIVPIPWNATVAPRVSEGLSRQATIGISTGSAILASLLIILALFCTFRRRKHRSATALTDRLIGSDALHEVTPVPYISIQELGHKSIPEMHGTGYHLELLDGSTPSGSGNDLTELADGVETPRRPSFVLGTRDNYGQAADASSRARSDASGDLLKDSVTRRPSVGNGPRKNATRSSHTTQTSRDTRTSLRVTKRTTRTSSQTRVRINVNKALPRIPQGKPPCHESHRSSGAHLGFKLPPIAYECNRSSLAHRTISEAASPLSPVRTYATIFDVEEYQDSAIVTKTEYGSF